MNAKTLMYAERRIKVTAEENGITPVISNGKLYLEVKSGKCYELSEAEILYQAEEYLKSEIEELKN